ncbi:acid phosphatase family membrane protein YuiD [Variovorax paradoxus]|uniref:Acid phosphatase family membrane protein YuiD n=1 Tax=Variovorax paradoxus TaxID=34073 RepID=A0AAE3XVJ9_VARPD|nr:divergent PAP2 family protein [Variovorax paradoxus]MDR6425664.1 acid phosphatase family membrane protein YuiD [Variovorax paradoxus]
MATDFSYVITPFLAWAVAGTSKFIINSVQARKLAFGLIGYGGLPSNHSAIVSSVAALVALKHGVDHPAFGVALALAFIVVLDAASLRGQVGKHAALLNKLHPSSLESTLLRERMGHSRVEIGAGILVGIAVAILITSLLIPGA